MAASGKEGPSPLAHRIERELVLMFGGRRALLLQLAHPLVAQGVADHSSFPKHSIKRLVRTAQFALTIAFGEQDEASQAISNINAIHAKVKGELPESVGRFPAGTPYSAEDPDLLLWVHATLIETALTFYRRFVGPLAEKEMDHYYQSTIWAATGLGIPQARIPPDYQSFDQYWNQMITGPELAVGAAGKKLSRAILYPADPWFPHRLIDPLNLVAIGTLPSGVRELYGLRWNVLRAAALKATGMVMPRAIRLLPARLRFVPQAFDERTRNPQASLEQQ